jgi:single-strand DNA-binding protein
MLNKVMLIGHLGKDPEMRKTQDGRAVANFSVATSESWKDKNTGEKKEKTEWHNVVVFNEGLAGIIEKYVKKGSKIYVEGKLQTRKWQDKDGNDRYTTEVILQGFDGAIKLLDGKNASNEQSGHADYHAPVGADNGLSEDIPF